MTTSTQDQAPLAARIRATELTREPVEAPIKTDERVLARITDGIYRQPSSALRELISNAYDADASEVTILTDAPRFSMITVRDNGLGLSPESLQHLVEHIGGSAKRTTLGAGLEITSEDDPTLSPGGRKLIGKLGIGLFSVAQFTRHFLIITKTSGEAFRTVADITLGPVNQEQNFVTSQRGERKEITTAHARIWIESAPGDLDSQGTEVKLLDLLPRTQAELASLDLWARIDFEKETEGKALTPEPRLHIGRMSMESPGDLIGPSVPWTEDDDPRKRFEKLVEAVRRLAESDKGLVDLESVCDRYLQTLWTLSLAAPLDYLYEHPFDLASDEVFFFELSNQTRGQATRLQRRDGETVRKRLHLKTPDLPNRALAFNVFVDGVQLFRPILFRDQPKTQSAVRNPLMFVGRCNEKFAKKPIELSGGPLNFEAYLFWTPKVIPTQHQGVIIRVGNASGAPFDRTFMGYQVSEQTRLRQISAEIFVRDGLEGAINLDRESYNYAHPHYQFLVKWLHSAIRQLTNRHKEVGGEVRLERLTRIGQTAKENLQTLVEERLKEHGIEDVPTVELLDDERESQARLLRRRGVVALRKRLVLPASRAERITSKEGQRAGFLETKAIAIAQILHGWDLLDGLSFEDQEILVRDILAVATRDGDQ